MLSRGLTHVGSRNHVLDGGETHYRGQTSLQDSELRFNQPYTIPEHCDKKIKNK